MSSASERPSYLALNVLRIATAYDQELQVSNNNDTNSTLHQPRIPQCTIL